MYRGGLIRNSHLHHLNLGILVFFVPLKYKFTLGYDVDYNSKNVIFDLRPQNSYK